LFRAESKIERTAVADLRLAIAITRLVAVEVSGLFAQPQLTVDITGDVEANEPASAGERVTQYAVEVSGVVLLPGVNLGSRARAYVLGGGGYLRQLHEGRLAVDTGRTLHAGAGVQYWLRGGTNPRQHVVGIRGEARVVHRVGGIDYEERARNFPAVGALLFVGF
jgi:hypothetical protein